MGKFFDGTVLQRCSGLRVLSNLCCYFLFGQFGLRREYKQHYDEYEVSVQHAICIFIVFS